MRYEWLRIGDYGLIRRGEEGPGVICPAFGVDKNNPRKTPNRKPCLLCMPHLILLNLNAPLHLYRFMLSSGENYTTQLGIAYITPFINIKRRRLLSENLASLV